MKAVRLPGTEGLRGHRWPRLRGRPGSPACDRRRARASARRQLHPDRADVAALDRSSRTRPGAADPGPRGVGHRASRSATAPPACRWATRCSASSTGTATAGPPTTWPLRCAAWHRSRRRSTSSKPPPSRRPRSRRGRRCSTTAISSPARRWSSTAPAAASGRWRCRSPAGPAPMSSAPVEPTRANACSMWAPMSSSTSSGTAGRPPSARSTWSTTSSAATCSLVRRRSSSPVERSCLVVAPPPTDRSDIRTVAFVRDPNGAQLREIARLVDDGTLRPDVSAVYPLADAREAFMAKSTEHIPGKVVLTP